ncbi:MAG: pyruvate kinase [Pseudomonadota bacterium]
MRRDRRAKILATLGPTSSEKTTIEALHRAGADVFRINMSHSTHGVLRELVNRIRAVENEAGRPIGILVDLQGPKLRIGTFKDGAVALSPGQIFRFDADTTPGDATRVNLPHPEILEAVRPGHRMLLDDGNRSLTVISTGVGEIEAEVTVGGTLSDRKGVGLPDTDIPVTALTAKDRSDLDAALECGADWIAVSFVQRPDDMAEVRKMVRGRAGVLAKIEKPRAVERLDEIVEISDAIMVARGDLGVEMPLEAVPGLQKQMIRMARQAGKPVVVATQMLESMIKVPVPTRAEVSDVASAIFEGTDAVMLSAESAAGDHPVEAVAMMDQIARSVEHSPQFDAIVHAERTDPEATGADAIAAACRQIAETLSLAAIVCYTSSGATGLRVARERPRTPIVALSPVAATARRLALVWGLHCVVSQDAVSQDDMVERACRIAARERFARPGARIMITAGVPFGTPGATNLLRLAFVGSTVSELS